MDLKKTGCKMTISSKFTVVLINFCSLFRKRCFVGKAELQKKYCNSSEHIEAKTGLSLNLNAGYSFWCIWYIGILLCISPMS